MKTHRAVALVVLMAGIVLSSLPSAGKDKGDAGRLLTGRVIDKQERPPAQRDRLPGQHAHAGGKDLYRASGSPIYPGSRRSHPTWTTKFMPSSRATRAIPKR